MVIKVLVADGKPLLEGELRTLMAHFPSDQLVLEYAESFPRNKETYFEMCRENQPDVVVLSPGFDPDILQIAVTNGFEHVVITSGEVRDLESYLGVKKKIEELIS